MHAHYDPMDTLAWMTAQAAEACQTETTTDAAGRPRRKSKAARERDGLRLEVLCEVARNVGGRQVSLEELVDRALA